MLSGGSSNDVEPLYREAVEQQSTSAFEAFALEVEAYYLTHSDYLLWHRKLGHVSMKKTLEVMKSNGVYIDDKYV